MPPVPAPPFGRVLTAMVTPFTADGRLDLDGAAELASYLLGRGSDGFVLNGTTGESPTTSDEEKAALVRAVRDAVGDAVPLVAGVGTYDTAHTAELARAAEKAGASGLLVVSPFYSKPPQAGLVAHVRAVADATGLPLMLYDIPGRTAVPFSTQTLLTLAEHPRVVAVKDAKDDLVASAEVLAKTDLAYYCGSDGLNLPVLAIGGVGVVSVTSHLLGRELAAMVERFDAGDTAAALALHRRTLPVTAALFRTQGVISTKAVLRAAGLPAGPVRLPLVDLTTEESDVLLAETAAAGVVLTGGPVAA